MQWRRSFKKRNGDVRKRFEQWGVPKKIRDGLGVGDGSMCALTIRIGTDSPILLNRLLTSGGEFRLPKDTAEDLRARATAKPEAEIVFDIHRARTLKPVPLNKARKKAISEGAFDPKDDLDARELVAALIVKRRGQPAFRKRLMDVYGNRCAITNCDCPDALEAAHIRPYNGRHTNHVKNGILLRSDVHTLFDLGKIRIEPSCYKVRIAEELQTTVYGKYDGKRLRLPKLKSDWPECVG